MKTLLYAFRIITRMKAYTAICILSLVVSLAGTVMLVRYIHQELTVDHCMKDKERMFLLTRYVIPTGESMLRDTYADFRGQGEVTVLNHPAVEAYTNIAFLPNAEVEKDRHYFSARAIVADSVFFRLVSFRPAYGATDCLSSNDVILSREFAEKLYGRQNPVGQKLSYGGKVLTVTGVMERPSTKTSLVFDMILSRQLHRRWWDNDRFSLVRLHRAEDCDIVNSWQPIIEEHLRYRLISLEEFYYNPLYNVGQSEYATASMSPKGDRNSLRILSVVAVLLFFVGVFNYQNLYLVIMQKRGLEFGVKKVFGAGRWTFFKQLYIENFLLAALAGLFIGMIVEISDKLFVHVFDIPIWNNPSFNAVLGLGMLFGFPLLSMLYPYSHYLYSRPVSSFKQIRQANHSPFSRNIFLSLQYVITFFLIVVSVYFAKQLHEMLHADLGFHTRDIVRCMVLPPENRENLFRDMDELNQWFASNKAKQERVIQELNASPHIESWCNTDIFNTQLIEVFNEDMEDSFHRMYFHLLNPDNMKVYGLELVEGVSTGSEMDVIINESAARRLGIVDLQKPVYLKIDKGGDNYPVVGILRDYRIEHLGKEAQPMVYFLSESGRTQINTSLFIRCKPGKKKEVMDMLFKLRNEVAGEGELRYSFIEDEIVRLYENDRRVVTVYLLFSSLAIIVSCLGLLGLSMFEIRLRYREIALRKVHGAQTKDIVRLILRRYLFILGLSALVAFPLTIGFLHWYMKDYAYRTSLSWWIFVVALLIVSVVSFGTLFWQIHKAANINPAEVMKRE